MWTVDVGRVCPLSKHFEYHNSSQLQYQSSTSPNLKPTEEYPTDMQHNANSSQDHYCNMHVQRPRPPRTTPTNPNVIPHPTPTPFVVTTESHLSASTRPCVSQSVNLSSQRTPQTTYYCIHQSCMGMPCRSFL